MLRTAFVWRLISLMLAPGELPTVRSDLGTTRYLVTMAQIQFGEKSGGPSDMFCQLPLRHHRLGPDHEEFSGLRINVTNIGGIYSWHDGANILLCDGHLQFFAEDTDPEVVLSLFSRAGGDG